MKINIIWVLSLFIFGCGPKKLYTFTGIHTQAKSVQVNFFQNYADQSPGSTIEPGLDRDFTNALQGLITNLTSLNLTGSNGDLVYEGEIVEYRVSPRSATANQTAAENQLTMTVQVRFFNAMEEDSNFNKRFSFFYNFPGTQLLENVKNEAHRQIFERITQDILNASLADW
ncbi:MAG: LptE family protein [Bacteroidota bacterium]